MDLHAMIPNGRPPRSGATLRASATRAFRLLSAGLIASLVWGAPANSADGPITLRVPVELKKMVAVGVRVVCAIRGDDQGSHLGITYRMSPIASGEFNQVVEMIVQPQPGKSFATAKTYRCAFDLKESENEPYHYPPEVGPPGPDLWKMAKPSEFFRREVIGQLTGVAVGGGPKGLQSK